MTAEPDQAREGEQTSALRSIRRALSLEVSKLESLRATAGLAMSAVMMTVGASVLFRGSGAVGGIGVAGGLAIMLWFLWVRALLRRRRFRPALGWVTVAFENTFPWAFYAVLGTLGQPADAHHDWGPLLLYCGVLVVGVLRLNPRYSLAMGAMATVLYHAVTWLILVPRHVALGGEPTEFTVMGEGHAHPYADGLGGDGGVGDPRLARRRRRRRSLRSRRRALWQVPLGV